MQMSAGKVKGLINRSTHKYESSGSCGFGEEDVVFYAFPTVMLWELMTTEVGPFLTPGA